MSIVVFQATPSAPVSGHPTETGDVVPGVSAYGVALGTPRERIHASPYLSGANAIFDDATGAAYKLGRGTVVIVRVRAGRVSEVDVHGPFKTAEGVTESCSTPEIQGAYGQPDEYYDIQLGVNPHPWRGAGLVLPLLGLATGGYLRWARGRLAPTSGGLAWMVAFGAIGLGIAAVAYLVALLAPTGVSLDWSSLLYAAASGALTGGGAVLALELVPRRLAGPVCALGTPVVMLLVAAGADQVVELARSSLFRTSAVERLLTVSGPCVLAMFLGAGMKRQA